MLDEAGRILLVRFVNPDTGDEFWATVGGGIDEGESLEAALRRELHEEAGLDEYELGPVVWTRREVFPWRGRVLDQRESYVLVRVPAFEPRPALGAAGLAAEDVHEVRWWTLEEVERSDALFYPTRLAVLLRQLLERGPPAEPLDAGV